MHLGEDLSWECLWYSGNAKGDWIGELIVGETGATRHTGKS